MKKLLLFITLFSLVHVSPIAACEIHKTVQTIQSVYYDEPSQTYLADTLPDETGGHWTLAIDNSDNLSFDELNAQYKGKRMEIDYVGDLQDDSDIEIISQKITN